MDPANDDESPMAMVRRLEQATNAHDLDALVGCFAEDYVNETPVHPSRGFSGREQVRMNWQQIFGAVPNVHARVVRVAADGDTAWSEWEMTGTRRDGADHLMRGVILFGVIAGRAAWARFYLELVQEGGPAATAAVAVQLAGRP
jgi:ketosteroid isomerase-like protein